MRDNRDTILSCVLVVCLFTLLTLIIITRVNKIQFNHKILEELVKMEQVTPTDTMIMYIEPDTLDYNTITRTIDAEIEIVDVTGYGVEIGVEIEVDTFTHDNDYIEGNIIIVDRDGLEYNIDSLITIYKKYHAK